MTPEFLVALSPEKIVKHGLGCKDPYAEYKGFISVGPQSWEKNRGS